jgi:hypothetical protein
MLFCCGIVLVASACGDSNKASNASNTTAAGSATTTSGNDAFPEACLAKDAAGAANQAGGAIDYAGVEAKLRAAVDKSPAEIRVDMRVMVDPMIHYFEIIRSVNGDYSKLQAADAQAAAQALGTPAFKAAQTRVQKWWAAHCR